MAGKGRFMQSLVPADRHRIRRKRDDEEEKETPLAAPDLDAKRAKNDPKSLSGQQLIQLQNTIGNRAVMRLLDTAESAEDAGRTPDVTTKVIRQLGVFEDMTVYFTKGDQIYHVEAYQKFGGVAAQVGVIDIDPENPVQMNARIDPESDAGNQLLAIAIKFVADEYAENNSGSVALPNNNSDVSKLMITKLSKVFGDRDLDTRAKQLIQMRRAAAAGASARPADLSRFDPALMMEHLLMLKSLLENRYGGKIDLITPLGRLDEQFGRNLAGGNQLHEVYYRKLMDANRDFVLFPNVLFRMFAKELKLDDL